MFGLTKEKLKNIFKNAAVIWKNQETGEIFKLIAAVMSRSDQNLYLDQNDKDTIICLFEFFDSNADTTFKKHVYTGIISDKEINDELKAEIKIFYNETCQETHHPIYNPRDEINKQINEQHVNIALFLSIKHPSFVSEHVLELALNKDIVLYFRMLAVNINTNYKNNVYNILASSIYNLHKNGRTANEDAKNQKPNRHIKTLVTTLTQQPSSITNPIFSIIAPIIINSIYLDRLTLPYLKSVIPLLCDTTEKKKIMINAAAEGCAVFFMVLLNTFNAGCVLFDKGSSVFSSALVAGVKINVELTVKHLLIYYKDNNYLESSYFPEAFKNAIKNNHPQIVALLMQHCPPDPEIIIDDVTLFNYAAVNNTSIFIDLINISRHIPAPADFKAALTFALPDKGNKYSETLIEKCEQHDFFKMCSSLDDQYDILSLAVEKSATTFNNILDKLKINDSTNITSLINLSLENADYNLTVALVYHCKQPGHTGHFSTLKNSVINLIERRNYENASEICRTIMTREPDNIKELNPVIQLTNPFAKIDILILALDNKDGDLAKDLLNCVVQAELKIKASTLKHIFKVAYARWPSSLKIFNRSRIPSPDDITDNNALDTILDFFKSPHGAYGACSLKLHVIIEAGSSRSVNVPTKDFLTGCYNWCFINDDNKNFQYYYRFYREFGFPSTTTCTSHYQINSDLYRFYFSAVSFYAANSGKKNLFKLAVSALYRLDITQWHEGNKINLLNSNRLLIDKITGEAGLNEDHINFIKGYLFTMNTAVFSLNELKRDGFFSDEVLAKQTALNKRPAPVTKAETGSASVLSAPNGIWANIPVINESGQRGSFHCQPELNAQEEILNDPCPFGGL